MNLTPTELSELLTVATGAARQAGDLVHSRINDVMEVKFKPDGIHNLVTEMDVASEELIKDIINDGLGPSRFLAEESGGNADLTELTWVVDPIDGTVNYAHGIPIYCVSIAAVVQNMPVVGAIYNPSTGEMFTTSVGGGAFLNGARLRVSETTELRKSIVVTGFPYNVAENPFSCVDSFADIMKMGIPIRRLGSAALDLAYLAAGRFDAYWEVALNEWDVAAGALMVLEAGGRIASYIPPEETSEQGVMVLDRLLATNGKVHDEILGILLRRGK